MKILISALGCCCFFALQAVYAQPLQPAPASNTAVFDQYVAKAVQDWHIPGLAIVVVKDGNVVFKKGYGVKHAGRPDPVDTKTLFVCASTTKAMTAACMGILVDEGKVNWDDPLIKYLPDFQLYDAYATRDLRVRDLFLHNSGVGNADFLWSGNGNTSDEILNKMRLVKPSYPLRSSFIYQNIFYLAAGKVIEKASGVTWAEFIKARIFKPLGMNRTKPTLAETVGDPNRTGAHFWVNKKVVEVDVDTADAIAPAGSVWSCVDDLALWVNCMIDSAKYGSGRLLKPATWAELLKPQTLVTEAEFYPTQTIIKPHWKTYGFGWFQHDYKGEKLNFHTGSLGGAIAIHAQIPDRRVGVFIVGNLDHAELRHALMYRALDEFALGGDRDWSGEFLTLYGGLKADAEKRQKEAEAKRVLNTRPSLPLEAYTGKYADPAYGEVTIRMDGDKLRFNNNGRTFATLEHWNYDAFNVRFDREWYGKSMLHFAIDENGKPATLFWAGMTFTRVP